MSEFKYNLGDMVWVDVDPEDDLKYLGEIVGYVAPDYEIRVLKPGETEPDGYFREADELTPYEDEGEVTYESAVPRFGMSSKEFAGHAEYLMNKSLERIGDVGPEQAFFGFQEFEGLTAQEVMATLMLKIEEGIALFAQAHILVGRTVVAMQLRGEE